MRSLAAAAALLLAATGASGGELIRFLAPDGRVGIVDHPSKLPPGATVVERRETTERAKERSEALSGEPSAEGGEGAGAGPAAPLEPAPARKTESAGRCLAVGLDSDCTPSELRGASRWCEQGRSARSRIEQAERALEHAEEELDDCETASLRHGYCTRRWLESAELELESAEQALSSLEDACRDSGCLPGWLRGDCGS
jgi:hypothetical protein